jgi:2-polyprenyl-6-methoxyphenol hydroxylase-like FAD-dependent oxidoreductase
VGGGLAGLSLGIALRRESVPVTLWEAGHYPRHRVCGEFINGDGQDVLERLGLRDAVVAAGGLAGRTAAFFTEEEASPIRSLARTALCVSRFTLDALLADIFRKCGGELREGHAWRDAACGEGVVRASGRRKAGQENGYRWFGLKVHAQNVALKADLEMHVAPNGYVGLCRVDKAVNVCGLFRRPVHGANPFRSWKEMLRGAAGSFLHERLAGAIFEEGSFCSVAGLDLKPRRGAGREECCVGDALTMIAPVTGNGMSMAFESAAMALSPLCAYSRGELSWAQAQQTVARRCDETFARRLIWARVLQWMMFTRCLRNTFGVLALRSHSVWRTMFERTR